MGRSANAGGAAQTATVVGVVSGDAEGRAIDQRWLAVFFARDEEVRRRFMIGRPSDEWVEASLVVNWFVPLTPLEADELGRKLFELVDELRHRRPPPDSEQTLVSLSILPVLGDPPGAPR